MAGLDDLDFDEVLTPPTTGEQAKPITIPASSQMVIDETSGERRAARQSLVEARSLTTSASLSSKPGDCLYLDIETVPDESRLHLFPLEPMPPVTPLLALMMIADFAALTVEKAREYLATVTPDAEWIDLAEAAESKREKPRKEIFKLLSEKRSASEDRIKELSVNPMYLRIIAIGLKAGDGETQVFMASPDDWPATEAKMLADALAYIRRFRPVIGFNIHFDLSSILVRSAILGVDVPYMPDRRKYGSPDVLDLMQAIYGDRCPKGCGMKSTAKMLGIDIPEDHGDGSQVYKLSQQRDWPAIDKYLRGDIAITHAIHQKIAGKLCQ